ncbi:MAG: hypothetical protein NWR51_07160 [Akkermansiaceae bacterium]|jgi:hypothetical protein|nr:hypothetical protein [Akkermansiaceae bacterium]
MKRQIIRLGMAMLIVITTAAAAWLWTQEYESDPDPAARFIIEAARVEQDHSRYWLELHLKKNGTEEHDLFKPVRLITADGEIHEPSKTDFAGNPKEGFTDIWFKFWLEKRDMEKNIELKINDGTLKVKTGGEAPNPPQGEDMVFKSSDWRKSWLGF